MCLLAVLPAVLCGLLVTAFLLARPSQETTTIAAHTWDGLRVPVVSVSGNALPPSAATALTVTPAAAATTPQRRASRRLRPSGGSGEPVCTSSVCRFAVNWLRSKVDEKKDPCTDFYGYACGTHRGNVRLNKIQNAIQVLNTRLLNESRIPSSNQVSWQKAAGLYQACMCIVETNRTETADLVEWMVSLGMDFNNETRFSSLNPADMMARCSFDLGVPSVLHFEMLGDQFIGGKRAIKLYSSTSTLQWLKVRRRVRDSTNQQYYANILRWFGVESPRDTQMASDIVQYEKTLSGNFDKYGADDFVDVAIGNFYLYTSPHISRDEWVDAISKYTNRTYTSRNVILTELRAMKAIEGTLKATTVGVKGLRYLVAWSVYTELLEYTVPSILRIGKDPSDTCYEHVSRAMRLAVMSPYLRTAVLPSMVADVNTMLSNIRGAFREKFLSSSWLAKYDRDVVVRKLGSMKTYVGSPGRRHEEDYVEELYKSYPDVPLDHLFPSWAKAMSLSAHQLWADQDTYLYDETVVNAHYVISKNTLVIPTAIISRPLFYDNGPPALNYGGLGAIVGHEMMHGFDVQGIDFDDRPARRRWSSFGFLREYTKRALCLRRSHRTALRQRSFEEVNDTIDSENLADLVGLRVAYGAFSSLPQSQRNLRLPGMNASAERLFFIGHCLKWCSKWQHNSPQYAPYRSRCIVPLMNMPEFSYAFGCKAGLPMNPTEKCKIWS